MTNFSDKPDEVLVELALLGNDQAFGELVTRHECAVKGTAYKITGNTFSAEDASQDAFVAAWMRLDMLADYGKFRSWVCSIAKNTALGLVRRYREFESISLDTGLLKTDIPDCAWEDIEQSADLHDAVSKLSDKIRETVELHYFEGYSIKEIADRLSVPEGTVMWRLSEGRRQLRKGYGIMEKEYNDKETLVLRVLRQVEQLKLWKLKNDKTGFEEEYRAVLAAVEELEDSKEKSHALADVMLMGYWWLPGERSDETFKKMKKLAEESRNEEVMIHVMLNEICEHPPTVSTIEKLEPELLEYLDKHGFKKAKVFVKTYFGDMCCNFCAPERVIPYFKEALELCENKDELYAEAKAIIDLYNRKKIFEKPQSDHSFFVGGEVLKIIGGKLYLWDDYLMLGGSRMIPSEILSPFGNATIFSTVFDPKMKEGDSISADRYNASLTCVSNNKTVVTEAGTFENCMFSRSECEVSRWGTAPTPLTVETAICPGVGIVYHRSVFENDYRVSLEKYEIAGNETDGFPIPFAAGNKWIYSISSDSPFKVEGELEVEVYDVNGDTIVISESNYSEVVYSTDSWENVFAKITNQFTDYTRNRERDAYEKLPFENPPPASLESDLQTLESLALTPDRKEKTRIATEVIRRILSTDEYIHPGYSERQLTDDYLPETIEKRNRSVGFKQRCDDTINTFFIHSEQYHGAVNAPSDMVAEWLKTKFTDLYGILSDAVGCLWSDDWKPGYEFEREFVYWGEYEVKLRFYVKDDETVTTPAGTFENCRHIRFDLAGLLNGWMVDLRGSWMDYWFAPGIGIVQYFRLIFNKIDMFWQLTDYKGTGEGYFPVRDGLFRRYEPTDIKMGYHAMAEYTFLETETGIDVVRNSRSYRDRADYDRMFELYRRDKT